jgi:tripeptidyl-peptidase-1
MAVSIISSVSCSKLIQYSVNIAGTVQAALTGFDYNGESNLDLQYGMALVTGAQDVALYQLGDSIQRQLFSAVIKITTIPTCISVLDASDNNLLNAFDSSYCGFDGGDDQNIDGIYPDQAPGGYKGILCALSTFGIY